MLQNHDAATALVSLSLRMVATLMAAKSAIIARSSSCPDSRLLSSLFLEAKVLVSELERLIDLAFQHVTLASLYFFFGHHGLIF